jgi:hypothetical protein
MVFFRTREMARRRPYKLDKSKEMLGS